MRQGSFKSVHEDSVTLPRLCACLCRLHVTTPCAKLAFHQQPLHKLLSTSIALAVQAGCPVPYPCMKTHAG